MLTFTNPRLRAEFADWPLGSNKRGKCVFELESHPKRGWRFVRTTTDPTTGRVNKPKTATYGGKGAIVDGSDGKTYLIQWAGQFDFMQVRTSDFMSATTAALGFDHAVFPEHGQFETLKALIAQANP
jgi:hypothetical protein